MCASLIQIIRSPLEHMQNTLFTPAENARQDLNGVDAGLEITLRTSFV